MCSSCWYLHLLWANIHKLWFNILQVFTHCILSRCQKLFLLATRDTSHLKKHVVLYMLKFSWWIWNTTSCSFFSRIQLKCDGTRWCMGGEVKGKLANGVGSQYPSRYLGTLLPPMRTPRLPAVEWTDAPADLNGLTRYAERRNLVSAHVPPHFNWLLQWSMTCGTTLSANWNRSKKCSMVVLT